MTIVNREKGPSTPSINHLAAEVEFLGFNRSNDHKALGMTQREFARQIGIESSTLERLDRSERQAFLNGSLVPPIPDAAFGVLPS